MNNPYSASNFYQTYQQQNSSTAGQASSSSSANYENPYYQPYAGPQLPTPASGGSTSHQAPVPANAYEYDVGILAQQSVYVPGAMIDKRGGAGGKVAKGGKRTTIIRKVAGQVWEDQTLLDWDPSWFRLFVGDLSNEVSDDILHDAFGEYQSIKKARVVRDRLSQKVKYGFVAFSDPEDFLRAWKEKNGKYDIGKRSNWKGTCVKTEENLTEPDTTVMFLVIQ